MNARETKDCGNTADAGSGLAEQHSEMAGRTCDKESEQVSGALCSDHVQEEALFDRNGPKQPSARRKCVRHNDKP